MFLYNVHTQHKTFALTKKDNEGYDGLVERIAHKAGLQKNELTALKEGKDGAGLVYEFEGGRFSLEDDDDLAILNDRLPSSSTPSVTFHLTPPHHHARFATSPAPPAYSTASSAIKSKAQKKDKVASKDFASSSSSKPKTNGHLDVPSGKKVASAASDVAKYEKEVGKTADGMVVAKPKSVMSTRSRRSKWGDDDAESLGDVNKRKWLEFHANNGVRTVAGKVGEVDNVRMLLKSGYKGVYLSRSFAIKAGLVDKKYGMGTSGYTGLKSLGNVPITVGSRTATHTVLINEEQHFDVVLGRTWLEKMAVKIDQLDSTALTYMDTGETIPCDVVVLKDAQGNVITVT